MTNRFNRAITRATTIIFVVTAALQAQDAGLKIKKLSPPGASYTFAFGINNNNAVVGASTDARGVYSGFLYKAGRYQNIVVPRSAKFTQALGINDSGIIVGQFIGKDQLTHGFVLKNGKFTGYSLQKGVSTYLAGINSTGSLVGSLGNNGATQGFVTVGGKAKIFSMGAQGSATYAYGINKANDSVGYFIPPPFSAYHGFIRYANGKTAQLDYPGSLSTACLGINDTGTITGFYLDAQNVSHGFIYAKGKFHRSNLPGVAGMNDHGSFVGSLTKNGVTYGYVATRK